MSQSRLVELVERMERLRSAIALEPDPHRRLLLSGELSAAGEATERLRSYLTGEA